VKIPNPIRFVKSMWTALRRLVKREPVVVPEIVQIAREAQCHKCPLYNPTCDQCIKCSCFVSLKILFAHEQCADRPRRWKKWKS
jgi:hypothetical protein